MMGLELTRLLEWDVSHYAGSEGHSGGCHVQGKFLRSRVWWHPTFLRVI
jgi:hypothetical protein